MSQQNQPNRIFQKLFKGFNGTWDVTQKEKDRSQLQTELAGDNQQLIIKRSELKQFAEKMAKNSWQNQQRIRQLEAAIQQLTVRQKKGQTQIQYEGSESWVTSSSSPSNSSIHPFIIQSKQSIEWLSLQNNNLMKQQERLVSLLNIKQQILTSNQKHIEDLVRNKQILQQRIVKLQNMKDTVQSKTIINLASIDLLKDDMSTSKQTCLKRKIPIVGVKKITVKEKKFKEMSQQTDCELLSYNDLEGAKLKLQISRLLSEVAQLQIKNQLLNIQNQHLSQECDLVNRKQRALQGYIYQSYLSTNKAFLNQSSSRYYRDESVRSNTTHNEYNQGLDKMAKNIAAVENRKAPLEPVPPPITPHFSCNMFSMFSKKNTFNEVLSNSFSDQIFESMSEQEQSQRSDMPQ